MNTRGRFDSRAFVLRQRLESEFLQERIVLLDCLGDRKLNRNEFSVHRGQINPDFALGRADVA